MGRYIIKRLGSAVVVVIGVSLITFILSNIVSDPLAANPSYNKLSAAQKTAQRHQLGLDRPLPVQYADYVVKALQGDLGTSLRNNDKVTDQIARTFPTTAILAVLGLMAEMLIGIPVGLVAALRRGSVLDRVTQVVLLAGLSVPVFWLGLLLLYAFGYRIAILPLGYQPEKGWLNFVLPAITIGLTGSVYYARLLRSQMLDELSADYTRTAHAKGLSGRTVVVRHVLRNAFVPIVTWAGLDLGFFLGGLVLVERVYSLDGMGKLAVDSVSTGDVNVIMGTVLFAAVLIVVANLLIDLMYPLLDPRIRYA